ncbi:C-type lectin domain family 9 member A-like [Nycticebus coucang]|uniref:C-type lectin domain family 9 member A-like n=1 Tax=Nycticebus coucang TaxID=9470 RepID=UPI00234CDD1B|nr:C-type lectin domain family 9 member A-like [Nycticebus coucang]
MSTALDCEQPPEITDDTETIPIVEMVPAPDHSLPPPLEDEWEPIPENTNVKASSHSCSLHGAMSVILGIFSLLLLMFCGFFAYQYFQSVQASESKRNDLKRWIEFFQNKAENFLQVEKVLDQNKETLQWLQNQNVRVMEALQDLKAPQGDRCGPPLNNWVQYMGHCYYQTVKTVPWLNCSDLCVSLKSSFFKTERSSLVNITKLLLVRRTWIGLYYKKDNNEWKWEDGSSPSPSLGLPEPNVDFQGKCVYINADTVDTNDCTTSYSCMCEKPVCATNAEAAA